MTHWSTAYLGTPWVAGESDCWNMARRVWREHFGLDVAFVDVGRASPLESRRALREADLSDWDPVSEAREGDAVLMAMGGGPCHVGIWLDGGRVLHAIEGAGVIISPASGLGLLGYRVHGIYRHRPA